MRASLITAGPVLAFLSILSTQPPSIAPDHAVDRPLVQPWYRGISFSCLTFTISVLACWKQNSAFLLCHSHCVRFLGAAAVERSLGPDIHSPVTFMLRE